MKVRENLRDELRSFLEGSGVSITSIDRDAKVKGAPVTRITFAFKIDHRNMKGVVEFAKANKMDAENMAAVIKSLVRTEREDDTHL